MAACFLALYVKKREVALYPSIQMAAVYPTQASFFFFFELNNKRFTPYILPLLGNNTKSFMPVLTHNHCIAIYEYLQFQ